MDQNKMEAKNWIFVKYDGKFSCEFLYEEVGTLSCTRFSIGNVWFLGPSELQKRKEMKKRVTINLKAKAQTDKSMADFPVSIYYYNQLSCCGANWRKGNYTFPGNHSYLNKNHKGRHVFFLSFSLLALLNNPYTRTTNSALNYPGLTSYQPWSFKSLQH